MSEYVCGYESFLRCLGLVAVAALVVFVGSYIVSVVWGVQ